MFGFNENKTVDVEFLQPGQEQPFAFSIVPIAELPDAMDPEIILEIDGRTWSVVDATPREKAEFQRTGKLRVIVSEVQIGIPEDALFMTATIESGMCALRRAESFDGMLVLHEDDWRQIEFVSKRLLPDIETEIESIIAIHETKRRALGFTEMHLRKLIERPIDEGAMPYAALKNCLRISKEFNGFAFYSWNAIAENGFAFETQDGLQFYGVLDQNDNVVFLCLEDADAASASVSQIVNTFNVACVDWCQCRLISS